MEIYIAVCLTIVVMTIFGVGIFAMIALGQMKRAARSLELLTMDLREEVVKVRNVTLAMSNITETVRNPIGKIATLVASLSLGAVKSFRQRRGNGHERFEERELVK